MTEEPRRAPLTLYVGRPVTLRKGDRVLIGLNDNPPPEHLHRIQEALHDQFPGVRFTLMANTSFLAKQNG